MSIAQAFSDRIKPKAIVASLIGYIVVSVVLFAVVFQFWLPSGVSVERLKQLAESDQTLLMWQNILGFGLGILAGYVACRMSGAGGLRNSLAVGVLLTLYGVLGIYLHPSHPALMQFGKLISPVPLALLGGWVALSRRVGPSRERDHA